jgi:parallel beta-helix repeat protein
LIKGKEEEMDGLVFYVATDGDDNWSGLLAVPNEARTDGPFASLVRARDAIREVMANASLKGPLTVMVRRGKYFLPEPLELETADSGTRECPIVYTAYPEEQPILSGGLKMEGWRPYKGNILQCSVPETKGGQWKFRQLFFNGKRQIRSRYPNLDPDNPVHGGWAFLEDTVGKGLFKFKFKPGTFEQRWAKPTQGEVNYYPNKHGQNVVPIKSIDWENRVIALRHEGRNFDRIPYYRYFDFSPNDRFVVENFLEELDQPGEWCLDTEDGVLYLWPPEPLTQESEVVAPLLHCLIDLRGASWITISGLTFTETRTGDNVHRGDLEGYGAMHNVDGLQYCGEAIHLKHAEHCCIEDNTFHGLGGNAIYLDGYNERNVVRRNEISHVGANGICVMGNRYQGWGESPYPAPQLPFYTQVVDNHIHECGELNSYVAGVFVGVAQGTLVAHNLIEDMPHHAVCMADGFGRTIVEYNEIRRVCRQYVDTAAINSWMEGPARYTAKDTERSGHVIRYNRISGVQGATVDQHGSVVATETMWMMGIYLDNYTSNCFVSGNVIITNGCGIHVNMGKNNIIENNVLVGCQQAARFNTFHGIWPHMYGLTTGNRFCRNIYCYSGGEGRLLEVTDTPGGHPPSRIFELSDHNVFFGPDGKERTVVTHTGKPSKTEVFTLSGWQGLGFDANSVFADPMFVDAESGDYLLQPDSPGLNVGFVPIDVKQIGVRRESLQ